MYFPQLIKVNSELFPPRRVSVGVDTDRLFCMSKLHNNIHLPIDDEMMRCLAMEKPF